MSTCVDLFKRNTLNRPTFGVVVPFFWTGRSIKLLIGIRDAALRFNVNLLFFQGYYCSQAYFYHKENNSFEIAGNFIFELIEKGMLDGLIINTGIFQSHSDKLKLLAFCEKYKPLPMISIGSAIDGITNVLIDNANGIESMMNHLIVDHSYRKIVFIRGPENHFDSNMRLKTYKEMIKKSDIPFNPEWVSSPGIWNYSWPGPVAIDMLEKMHNEIDAFVCISDMHARAVISALRNNGIRIPQDIAVVGFNDEPDAQACVPAITTIQLNLYERGYIAIQALLETLDGKPLPENLQVGAPLVIRQSCGCLTAGVRSLELVKDDTVFNRCDHSKDIIITYLKNELYTTLKLPNDESTSAWVDGIINCISDSVKHYNRTKFLATFSKLLYQYASNNNELGLWHWALNLFCSFAPVLFDDVDKTRVECVLTDARFVLGEVAEKEQGSFLKMVQERNTKLNTLSKSFKKTYEIHGILDTLAEYLPGMGIPACYLSLYENTETPLHSSRLVLAYNKGGRIDLPPEGIAFPTYNLIPEHIVSVEQLKPLIIEPLFHSNHQLGFVLFEFDSKEQSFYELFPAQLSALFWGSMIFKKEQQNEVTLALQASALEKSNGELQEKSQQLNHAYEQLVSNQEKLIYLEKMVALGKLTAGIAHEMNTPLATVRAALSELKSLVNEYTMSIKDPEITYSDHKQIASEMINSTCLADKAANVATSFIQSIRTGINT